MIYLDYAATTPMSEDVLNVYLQAAKKYYGNPSSLHDVGSEANELLTVCRKQFAKMISGEEDGVFFTSGGSESNILAIRSLIERHKDKGNHLITTEVEHSSVYNLFKQLEDEGYEVTYLSIDHQGHIDIDDLKMSLTDKTILASIHHGNSEIGAVQDIPEIGLMLKENGTIFHTDCVQTFGKIPLDVKACHIDSLSIASHKIYGPKGVGLCYINPHTIWTPQQKGTTHEKGFRPGTVNVPGILAFTNAAQEITSHIQESEEKYQKLRHKLLEHIKQIDHHITVFESNSTQLPSIMGMTISGIQGQYVMLECNRSGIAISTGSACQVGKQNPSRTMLSLGKTKDEAKELIRLSFGIDTTEAHIEKTINTLEQIIKNV